MRFDDRAADGKSHAQPPVLGRIERLEDMLAICEAYTPASIKDSYGDFIVSKLLHLHPERLVGDVRLFHGFDSVAYKIQHDLLNLDVIRENERQPRRYDDLDP